MGTAPKRIGNITHILPFKLLKAPPQAYSQQAIFAAGACGCDAMHKHGGKGGGKTDCALGEAANAVRGEGIFWR